MWSVKLAKDEMNLWGPKGSVIGGPASLASCGDPPHKAASVLPASPHSAAFPQAPGLVFAKEPFLGST